MTARVLKAAERMRKSSVHSRSIRRVLKAFGKYTESVWKVNMRKVFGLF